MNASRRRPAARPKGAPLLATQAVLEKLRWRIQCSALTQRTLERRLGFSKGYLSQVLRGHVDLKINHLLALLEALAVDPGEFFSEVSEDPVYPLRSAEVKLEASSGPERELGAGLARLYSFGLQSLDDFEKRLERCEVALSEARTLGLLDERDL